MPGIRIMNQNGADAGIGENRKRTHEGTMVNGDPSPRKDGTISNGAIATSTNGAVASVAGSTAMTTDQLAELPPEIAHLTSEYYHPLSKLLIRISQECFNSVNDTLVDMSKIPIDHLSNGALPNGLGGHANGIQNNSEGNKQKKLILMRFAQESRAKFIKMLVLTEWGKKSSLEISKVIDLFTWTRDQSAAMDTVDWQSSLIKEETFKLVEKNPDIRTALEILSTGKAEWIPDMGLIPPEPLSSQKALKLLRYMNTSLAIRLNVHENLPRHLRKWHIANGKATFTIDSEFELDVVSFCEDDSDQWHFIDLRLLFSPAPTIAVGTQFQNWFKPQLDGILKEKGLAGCFDFVHNFLLTHKIAVLKSQAYQLVRGPWAGSIKVEPVHRQLIVQYWTDRPGKKNWIEIGVSSSKPKDGKVSWRGPPIPKLSVRWFREGKEVKDVNLKVDFTNLSMERILKSVISQHAGHFLRTTRNALPASMVAKAASSETEPCDCTLEISLGRPENRATLSVESVTGKYILRPSTAISFRAEQVINQSRDPLATTASTITQLLAQSLQDVIQRIALQLGWQKVARQTIHIDAIKKATKLDALQFSLYWPSGWTTKWALAAIIDASSETWWFVELGDKGKKIEYAEQLRMEKTGPVSPISRTTLAGVERLAVQQLEFFVTRRELHARNLPSAVRTELAVPSASQILQGWVLQLRTADLLVANSGEDPWLDPLIRITSQGFINDYRSVSHIASGTMVKSVAADMQKLMAASPQSNFTFSENGNFAILLTTPFGEPIIDELKARLRDVDRLRSFTTTLQKRKMRLRSSSLQQVQFQYSKDLIATVNFGQEKEIKIKFNESNPHNRISYFLTDIINEQSPFALPGGEKTGLDRFCKTLILTRPLLSTLTELENSTPGNLQNPAVFAHHVGIYRLTYANPLCSFDIRLKPKDDKVYWHIEDNDRKQPDMKPAAERNPRYKRLDALKAALASLFARMGPNKTWKGLRSGIVADVDGIPDALRTLHQTVVSCAVSDGQLPFQEASPSQQQQTQQQPINGTGQGPQKNPVYPNGNTARQGQQAIANGNRPNFPNAGRPQQQQQMKPKQEVIELD